MNVLPACSVLALLAALPAGIAQAAPDPALCPPAPARADRVFRVAQADTAAAPDEAAHNKAPPDEARIAAELSDLLQACSYDGSRLTVAAKALQGAAEGDGGAVVASIMKFTGLPPNFQVVEGDVPNAAAVILMGPDDIPVRVIAYNRGFIDTVREATQRNDWAPVSVMAHEIGHHLGGHTLVPGGSQPPIELEADRFSGFVLHKMGADLDQTTQAIRTLIP